MAALIATGFTIDASTISLLIRDADRFHNAGASVQTISVENGISGAKCESLNGSTELSAGAIRPADTNIVASALPNSALPTFEVSPSLIHLLMPKIDRDMPGGIFLAQDVAETLGVVAGDSFPSTEGLARIAGVYSYPNDGRRSDLRYAVLVPISSRSSFSECWAENWPNSGDSLQLLRSTVTLEASTAGTAIDVSQLNSSLGRVNPAPALFESRATESAPLFVALASFLGLVLASGLRRVEFASSLEIGISRWGLLAIIVVETGASIIFALVVASAIALLLTMLVSAGLFFTFAQLFLRDLVMAASFALLGSSAGVMFTNQNRLYKYFKAR
ncbi:hypothetical protein [Rathayibacter tritici]|uniref:hypothetical protein n=1 Tax=Rathayibacter tritici TaxID=33888 RepID=UPI0011B0C431|nr:hypothetical protein [Rathayibacter tritici]